MQQIFNEQFPLGTQGSGYSFFENALPSALEMGENIGEALIADAFKNLSDAQQTTTKAVPTFEEFSNELNREEALNMTTAVENLRSSGRLPEGINTLEQFYNRFLENDVNFADFGTISSPNIDSSPVKSEIARIQQQLQVN